MLPRCWRPSVQIKPPQSIVLSFEEIHGILQPSEFVGDFFQADGWGRLPVTQEVAGSSPALYFSRRFYVTGRSDKLLLKWEALERVSAPFAPRIP